MANALSIDVSVTDDDVNDSFPVVENLAVARAGVRKAKGTVTAGAASDTALPIPSGTLGRYILVNKSTTGTVTVKTASSGTVIGTMLPGEPMSGRFPSNITAPVVNGSIACDVDFAVYEA